MKNKQAPLAQLAEQLTLNQWVLGSSPRGRTLEKILLILRNRRDFCVPLEIQFWGLRCILSSLLRVSMLGRRYSPSFLQGTRPRFASDTLMSLRAIPSFLAWLPSAAMGNIYTSAYLWFRGSWNPAGSLGCAVVPCVRPVPSELGRGKAVACLVCCLLVGCLPRIRV